jgi:prepilin-type N-terminal cleavage/methylation domain-containing protein
MNRGRSMNRMADPAASGPRYAIAPQRSGHHHGGFTLIELVISAALMSLILVSAYLCLHAALTSRKVVEPRAEILQNARVAMALVTADLRHACPLSKEVAFLGLRRVIGDLDADNLDFATHNYTPRRPREADYCQESLYLDRDPDTGRFSLWRRRNPVIALDPLSGGSREEIAQGVVGLRFEYYDGFDWYDTWGELPGGKREFSQKYQPNLHGLPEAVRVTLRFDSNPKPKAVSDTGARGLEPPLVFQSVVRLNLAGRTQPGDASETSGQPAAPGAPPHGLF